MHDEREIADLVRGLIDAWNLRDAEGFAGLFVPSAEYITGYGESIRGRDSIAELVRQAGAGSPVSLVDGPSIECDGAAGTVRFGWAIMEQGIHARRGAIVCTLVRQDAGWLIEALQNNERRGTQTVTQTKLSPIPFAGRATFRDGTLRVEGRVRYPNDFSTATLEPMPSQPSSSPALQAFAVTFHRDKEPFCDADGIGPVVYSRRAAGLAGLEVVRVYVTADRYEDISVER